MRRKLVELLCLAKHGFRPRAKFAAASFCASINSCLRHWFMSSSSKRKMPLVTSYVLLTGAGNHLAWTWPGQDICTSPGAWWSSSMQHFKCVTWYFVTIYVLVLFLLLPCVIHETLSWKKLQTPSMVGQLTLHRMNYWLFHHASSLHR